MLSEAEEATDPDNFHTYTGIDYSSNTIGATWNASSDQDNWIENIALAMTNSIRTNHRVPTNPFYAGKAYRTATFVRVRWGWLAFSIAMLSLSTLFVFISIFQTQQSRVPAWKNNPFAFLLMGIEQNIKNKAEGNMETPDRL